MGLRSCIRQIRDDQQTIEDVGGRGGGVVKQNKLFFIISLQNMIDFDVLVKNRYSEFHMAGPVTENVLDPIFVFLSGERKILCICQTIVHQAAEKKLCTNTLSWIRTSTGIQFIDVIE